jgi:starch synthase
VGLTRPEHFYDEGRLRDNFNHSAINLMKGGIAYSNFITTVSPQHAWEVTDSDQGTGLGHTLHIHRQKFGGVLNGIDYDVWEPEIDILIPSNYTVGTVDRKYANKDALQDQLLLRKEFKPVISGSSC